MMRRLAPLAAPALLAGCVTPPADPPDPNVPPPAPGHCDATASQRLLGKPVTPALVETARRGSRAALVRTITPGTMVTMDYRPDRLNVTVDARNMVTAIRCG